MRQDAGWVELGTFGPTQITPDASDIGITPSVPGIGSAENPFILTTIKPFYGELSTSVELITISNQRPGDQVVWVDNQAVENGVRFQQAIGTIGPSGSWSGKLNFHDTPNSDAPTTYNSILRIGDSEVYFSWSADVIPDGNINTPIVLAPGDGAGSGDQRYLKTDKITSVEGGGTTTVTTSAITTAEALPSWDRDGNAWSNMTNRNWQSFGLQFQDGSTSGSSSRSDCKGEGAKTSFSGAGITNVRTLRVNIGRRPSGPGATFVIDGVDYQSQVSSGLTDTSGRWKTITGPTTFNSFESTGGATSNDCYLIWNWEVNGVLLTNSDLVGT